MVSSVQIMKTSNSMSTISSQAKSIGPEQCQTRVEWIENPWLVKIHVYMPNMADMVEFGFMGAYEILSVTPGLSPFYMVVYKNYTFSRELFLISIYTLHQKHLVVLNQNYVFN